MTDPLTDALPAWMRAIADLKVDFRDYPEVLGVVELVEFKIRAEELRDKFRSLPTLLERWTKE